MLTLKISQKVDIFVFKSNHLDTGPIKLDFDTTDMCVLSSRTSECKQHLERHLTVKINNILL